MPKLPKHDAPPLICILCPGNKRFSDLSHLLTHLNSKGHLQNKHKLELRCGSDQDAKNTLEQFAHWYNDNNFAELLTERMQPKDKKRNVKAGKVAKPKVKKPSQKIKPESESDDEPKIPHIKSHHMTEPQANPLLQKSESQNDGWSMNMYGSPKSNSVIPGYSREATVDQTPIDPSLSDDSWKDLAASNDGGSVEKAATLTLKGEVFTGMAVFDSATPRTKRQRNQRKGPQVMQQMMKNSAEVEPAEVSYHASGELRGSRNIYDPISEDGSPDRRITPSPPRKRRASRIALTNKSTNKLINIPKLRPAAKAKSISLLTPAKRSTISANPDYLAGAPAFSYEGDFGHSHSSQTINPFKLFLQPEIQSGGPFAGYHAQISGTNNNSKKVRFEAHRNHSQSYRSRPRDTPDFDPFLNDRTNIKVETWNMPLQNPLTTYKEPDGSFNEANNLGTHQMLSSFAGFNQKSNRPDGRSSTGPAFQRTRMDDHSSKLNSIGDGLKGPRAGFFKTATPWSTLPPQKVPVIIAKELLAVAKPGDQSIVQESSKSGRSKDTHLQPTHYGPEFSPNMMECTAPDLDTPKKKSQLGEQVDVKRRKRRIDHDQIEEELLATPRYNLRQAPSSSLRSTARSPHSSARLRRSAAQLHYSSDIDSELFSIV